MSKTNRQLIDDIKTGKTLLAAVPDRLEEGIVTAANEVGAEYLTEQLVLLTLQEAELKKQMTQVKDALKLITPGDALGVAAKGRVLFKVSRYQSLGVNTDAVKENFPDADFPQLYKMGTLTERLNVDSEFKASVIAKLAQGEVKS